MGGELATASDQVPTQEERFRRRWPKRLSATLSILAALVVVPTAIGSVLPGIPIVGLAAAVLTGFYALHLVLIGIGGAAAAIVARRLTARKRFVTVIVLNTVAAVILVVPLFSQVIAAERAGAKISWMAHMIMGAPLPKLQPSRTVEYATLAGRRLFLDIYDPSHRVLSAQSTPVIMIHGGGFLYGHRSDGRDWDRWFAERGYTVFDVDYRLTPPVSWNLAAQDVACAMSWVREHQRTLNVSAAHTLIVGQSAGASLALQVAYGIGDDSVKSSCGGVVEAPIAVFALYPVEDFRLAWRENLRVGPANGRDINIGYIGGSPQEFPERYQAVSPVDHVRAGIPPTMIAFGAHDHLVPVIGHGALSAKLQTLGVPRVFLEIPYSDHGYDLVWGSLGGQTTRAVLSRFLAEHCPAAARVTGTQAKEG